MIGTLEEKKRLQSKSNLFVALAILLYFGNVVLLESMRLPALIHMSIVLPALVCWFIGLGVYAKSKGYMWIIGVLLGILSILGLLILLVLPNRYQVQAAAPTGPSNYPRQN